MAPKPYAEPNSFGELSPDEWREAYSAYVGYFAQSARTDADVLMLEIRLKWLGYAGTLLNDEVQFIRMA